MAKISDEREGWSMRHPDLAGIVMTELLKVPVGGLVYVGTIVRYMRTRRYMDLRSPRLGIDHKSPLVRDILYCVQQRDLGRICMTRKSRRIYLQRVR